MPNTELFAKIRDMIREHPEQHDQSAWESQPVDECGTTRCVAGWAVYLEAGAPLLTSDSGVYLTPEVEALGLRLGLVRGGFEDDLDMIPVIAQRLLGLDDRQAHQLFYRMNNQQALEQVERYAEGE